MYSELTFALKAVADYPASIFPEELLAAYPEAKVILTIRGEDEWYKSMMATVWHGHITAPADDVPREDSLRKTFHFHCWDNDFPKNGRALFQRHNALVRSASEKREFLEFRPEDGWGTLCEFPGVPVPSEPYPRTDAFGDYKTATAGQHAESGEK